jgi:hypothetical protein
MLACHADVDLQDDIGVGKHLLYGQLQPIEQDVR